MGRSGFGMLCLAALLAAGGLACGDDESENGGNSVGGSGGVGGNGGSGATTSGGAGGEDPGIVVGELASRSGGVAPLAVFFDAVATPDVIQPPEVDGHQEYGDLHYQWDFGDPDGGAWAVSGRSKNQDTGYVAAHVYETPGTYTARLTVTDAEGAHESYQVEIVVEDPEAVYGADATVCVSTGADFTGCPDGATQVTTSEITDIEPHIAETKRILLRRGDSWTTTGSVTVSSEGPLTIGAFGSCDSPDARGICANAPAIQANGATDTSLFTLHHVTDARLMDLRLSGPPERHGALGGVTGIQEVLVRRLSVRGFGTPLGASHWETQGHDQYMFVECDAGQTQGNVIYTGSERLALLGNRFHDPSDSHVVRVWQAHKGVISHNDISGSSVDSDSGRHALKFHGPDETAIADPSEDTLARRSQFVVIADNVFGGSGPWPVAIGPQDSGHDERVQDVVVERNRFFPGYGTPSCCSSGVQVALSIWARYVTVRNNVFSGQDSSEYYTAISLSQRGGEPPPLGHRVLNNTIYKSDLPGGYCSATAISIDATAVDTMVRNNLVHFIAGFDVSALIDGQGTGLVEDHNLMTDSPGLVDPDHQDFLSKDFSLSASSPAIDSGTEVPVFDDFAGAARPNGAGYDLGAFER